MSFSETPSAPPQSEYDPNTILDSIDLDAPIAHYDPFEEEVGVFYIIRLMGGFKKLREVGALRHNSKRLVQWIVAYFVSTTLLQFLCRLTGDFIDSLSDIIIILLIIGVVIVVGIVIITALVAPLFWIQSALNNAHYKRAIRLSRLLKVFPIVHLAGSFFEGKVYSYAGNWAESEQILRKNLSKAKDKTSISDTWEYLGNVLLPQGKYIEALQCFQYAITIEPANAEAYNGLAEVYLYQGINPQRAFDLAERALNTKHGSPMTRFDENTVPEMLLNKAWASQLLGNPVAADEMILEALSLAGEEDKPLQAGLYYRTSQIMQLRRQRVDARNLLLHAIDIDPKGKYGTLARQALQELSAR